MDVLGRLLVQVLADPVQLLRGAQRVERQLVHVGLDEAILWVVREDVVDQSLVARSQGGAAATTTC